MAESAYRELLNIKTFTNTERKTLRVKTTTWKRVMDLKYRRGCKSVDELLLYLIDNEA
jgi:hypothetical protein